MKHILQIAVLLQFIAAGANAQAGYGTVIPVYIEPFPIEVSTNKTTNLLFHYKIRNVDLGSEDIIDSLCNDTALLVKANRAGFPTTNLSVYTADGKLFAFTVAYKADPAHLAIQLQLSQPYVPSVTDALRPIATDDVLELYCKRAAGMPSLWAGHREKEDGISARLSSIYVHANVFFLPFELSNHSKVGYDIASFRFFIADKKRAKRTATQQMELRPLYIWGNPGSVPGKGNSHLVFALPKFTLPDKKAFKVVIQEQGGGRNLELRFSNRTILRAGMVN